MARFLTRVHSPLPAEEAFAYMADLTNFAQWDPGVRRAEQVTGDTPAEGAEFDVEVDGIGGSLTLRYRITAHRPPDEVVAEATTSLLRSLDRIMVEPASDGGSVVTYDAQLTLRGVLGLADPLLAVGLRPDRSAGREGPGRRPPGRAGRGRSGRLVVTSVADPTATSPDDRTARYQRLRWFNLVMGGLHAVSGAAMVALGNDFSLDASTLNLNGPPGTPLSEGTLDAAFAVPLAPATAAFLFLSALFHFLIASPLAFDAYRRELADGRNRFRWVEYSLSSTLMIVLIALVTGLTDLAALIGIAGANVAMILFGWIMEVVNEPGERVWWTPFWFGCIAGITPWAALVAYLWVNVGQDGAQGPPGFVYGILVSIFVLFNSFALNQWLQYRQVGRWRDYLFGESVYIVLSLTAKTLLAWQIFANTLID